MRQNIHVRVDVDLVISDSVNHYAMMAEHQQEGISVRNMNITMFDTTLINK